MPEEFGNQLPVQPQIILVALAAVLSVGIFVSPYALDAALLNKGNATYNTTAQVVANNTTAIGASTDNESLQFGRMISDEMNFTRTINVATGNDTIVLVDVEGNITDHLDYAEVHRFNGSKNIPFRMIAREPGNYTGTVSLNIHVSKTEGASTWLDIKQAFY